MHPHRLPPRKKRRMSPLLIDDWIKRENDELKKEIAEMREDMRLMEHRLDTVWWKMAVLATVITVAVGKVFGNSILSWVTEAASWVIGC